MKKIIFFVLFTHILHASPFEHYFSFYKKYGERLGEVGNYKKGEIEILFSEKEMSRCMEGQKNRLIAHGWDEKKAKELLDILIKNKVVHSYPILVEANGQKVAQAEHTFIPTENGVTITTIL